MDILFYLFAAVAIVTAIQAAIAIWTPRVAWVRMSAVIITALMMPLAYMSFTLLMSKPKPISLEWYERNAPRATVLGVSLDEGRAIYLWLMLDGETEPRAYVMPWQQQNAEQLEDTLNAVVQQRAGLVLKKPFTRRSEMESKSLSLEIVPPPSMPLKRPPPPPRIFNPRQQDI
jgi:hypothetical protein